MVPECHQIKTSGGKCGAPALRGQLYCYFHSRPVRASPVRATKTRSSQPRTGLAAYLPEDLEDRGAIQRAITEVAKALAENRIEPKRGGLILYALQIAAGNAKGTKQTVSSEAIAEPTPKVLIPAALRLSSIESAMDRPHGQLKPLKANGFSTEMGLP